MRGATIGAKAGKIGVRIGVKIAKIEEKIELGFCFLEDLGTLYFGAYAACYVFHASAWPGAVMIARRIRQILRIQKLRNLKLKNLRSS